jgi:hypothetical protein
MNLNRQDLIDFLNEWIMHRGGKEVRLGDLGKFKADFVDHYISEHPEGDGLQIAIEALTEIAKGEGRYDMDRLRHAANCIEDMQQLAKEALSKLVEPPKEQTNG